MISVHLLTDKTLLKGDVSLIAQWQAEGGTLWVDIESEDSNTEQRLLTELQCHPLAIQDAQRANHPPKVEHFTHNSFILYRNMRSLNDDLDADMQNIAFFVGANYLITVHKNSFSSTSEVEQHSDFVRLMQNPADLMCMLLRLSANLQLERIARFEDNLSTIEELMSFHGSDSLLAEVTGYRTRLRRLKRLFDYQEKAFAQLVRDPKALPSHNKGTQHSLQDVYDKFERLLNLVTLYYDLCGDLSDAYLSISSHQLNKTMQVLTVITAIFIPLTFIVGVYGMNFVYMPELQWRYGYFGVLLWMLAIALGLLALFKHKKWL